MANSSEQPIRKNPIEQTLTQFRNDALTVAAIAFMAEIELAGTFMAEPLINIGTIALLCAGGYELHRKDVVNQ